MSNKGIKEVLSRFHHVGVLVRNMDEAIDYYKGMGFGPFYSPGLIPYDRKLHGKPVTDVANDAQAVHLGPVMFELVQPVSGQSIQQDWLDSKGEGVNHICFAVDDIEEATSIMVEEGYTPMSSCKFEGGGGMAYFDTDRTGGVQIELIEEPLQPSEYPG